MKVKSIESEDIDAYISRFPRQIQNLLQQMRQAIHNAAPTAEECISYQLPAFKKHKILVYFAGYKNHIGFYPTLSAIEKFKDELSHYKTSKGAVQFPLDKPLPLELITEIVNFRLKEEEEKAVLKLKISK